MQPIGTQGTYHVTSSRPIGSQDIYNVYYILLNCFCVDFYHECSIYMGVMFADERNNQVT
jgi:hypothetical protein